MIRPVMLVLSLIALAGCAKDTSGKYPSLALRPIESRTDELPDPDATPAAVAADPALDAQVATTTGALDRNAADFAAAATRAEAAAKTSGARTQGSDAWLAAQGSLADLEALHGDLLGLAGDLDRSATDRAQAGGMPYPALDAVQAKAQTEADRQAARIAAIKASLGEK